MGRRCRAPGMTRLIGWRDEKTGLPCLMKRNHHGAWCGYVAVPPGHRWHGKDYDEVPVEVHGGLTYSDRCVGEPGEEICHVPLSGEPEDVFWFGFDCAHSWDVVPAFIPLALYQQEEFIVKSDLLPPTVYRDQAFVTAEVTRLAAQLA